MDKLSKLEKRLKELASEGIVLAFSGGIDSTLLLYLVSKIKTEKIVALTFENPLMKAKDIVESSELAKEYGIKHLIISEDKIPVEIENNPVDRCYLCKRHIFTTIINESKKLGFNHIIDGTNADDIKVYRPGIKALDELGIISPLLELGISKVEVREFANRFNIRVSNKPSSPCMATRLPYDTNLNEDDFKKLENIENEIIDLGFKNIRARLYDNLIRLEVDSDDLNIAIEKRQSIIEIVKKNGYSYTTLDLEGFRSGSMDINL